MQLFIIFLKQKKKHHSHQTTFVHFDNAHFFIFFMFGLCYIVILAVKKEEFVNIFLEQYMRNNTFIDFYLILYNKI